MTAPTRLTGTAAAAALAELGVTVDADPASAGGAASGFSEQLLAEIVAGYLEALNAGETAQPDYLRQVFTADERRPSTRYLRIVSRAFANGGGGGVHAFIDVRDGSLHKPGGLKGPAKNRSGQLIPRHQLAVGEVRTALFARLATGSGRHGGYLYATT